MGWIHPLSWALYTTIESLNSQKGPLFRLSHIFLLSILSVVPGVWPVFGFNFSTRDILRNQRIWWRVRTTSDDIIFTSKVPCCQLAIYWVLRGQLFLSLITSPIFFSKVRLVSETTRSDISREPIKVSISCKNALELIRAVTTWVLSVRCNIHSWSYPTLFRSNASEITNFKPTRLCLLFYPIKSLYISRFWGEMVNSLDTSGMCAPWVLL